MSVAPLNPIYLGAMTGTSLDGLDMAALTFDAQGAAQVLAHQYLPMPPALRDAIAAVSRGLAFTMADLARSDIGVARFYRDGLQQFMQRNAWTAAHIAAIGMHGQTVHHQPPATGQDTPFTLQLGDPYVVATALNCPVVADFRRRDVALGGQGAPLVPAFHHLAFADAQEWRAVLNLGGIANITLLARDVPVLGYDTGPANMLMDAWIQQQQGLAFDDAGAWAASGQVDARLLERLLSDDYFALAAPKSTGRERFGLDWLLAHVQQRTLVDGPATLSAEDVQRTLLELSARTIADAVHAQFADYSQKQKQHAKQGMARTAAPTKSIIVCGGGARNTALLARLRALCPDFTVRLSSDFGIAPEAVEAAAFAYFARATVQGLAASLPSVTGASRAALLGTVFLP